MRRVRARRGTITPPHSSVVGVMPVHFPSANICTRSPEFRAIEARRLAVKEQSK
jgi:hypothetical protein